MLGPGHRFQALLLHFFLAAGALTECVIANAGGVARKRLKTGRRIVIHGIVCKRTSTDRRVLDAGHVAEERLKAVGRVGGSGCIIKERLSTARRVPAARGIANERSTSSGSVEAAGGIAEECIKTIGRVVACGVVAQGKSAGGRVVRDRVGRRVQPQRSRGRDRRPHLKWPAVDRRRRR